MKPLAIDLFCGLGGWTEGLLAAGYRVVGFDIERHQYGEAKYPAQLVLQDILTLHGSQFKGAALIVASPPCQRYSYMAMPWSRAKAMAAGYRKDLADLNDLFNACFRIQREASEAAGRYIPMVIENVKGAQPWVGRAAWHYGSFYLWGDVPALMPSTQAILKRNPDGTNHGTGSWFAIADSKNRGASVKNSGGSWFNVANNTKSGKGNNPDGRGIKVPSEIGSPTDLGKGARFTSRDCGSEGVKVALSGRAWFSDGLGSTTTPSPTRKAASAAIAKIPFDLSYHIGRVYHPGTHPILPNVCQQEVQECR